MVQTQSPTNEGYGELGKLVSGEAATAVKSVCCLKTSCTADETQTSSGVTKCTESGLTLVNADSVKSSKTTVNNDTVELDHVFTAGASATVKGFGIWNDDDDVLYGICCFAADVAMESSDTLTVEMKMQFKKGS
jgi:hypothetical protein